MYSGAEAGLPWTVSLLLESDLYKYSQALEGGWSPIPLDIILTEADLYLLWRLPHLPSVRLGWAGYHQTSDNAQQSSAGRNNYEG